MWPIPGKWLPIFDLDSLSLSLSLSPFFPEIGICEMKFRPQVKCVTE